MKNKLILSLALGTLLMVSPSRALAESYGQYGSGCSTNYGQGCGQTQILIDKKIQTDTKGATFVDSLSINESRLSKDQKVTFQITVKNISDTKLESVEVKDIFPDFLTFVSGSGKFDANTRTLTFTTTLNAGESKNFVVIGKITDPKNISNGSVCVVNRAIATTQSGETEQDTASYCIEKNFAVLSTPSVKQTPATGPEMFSLLGLIPAGLSGLILRRKASK